jgi:5-methylcytosine-specific restriction endonuclease McrA
MTKNTRKHQLANPSQELERRQARQERSDEYGSKVDRTTAELICILAKARCFYCDVRTFNGHVDHMTPVVQGGSNDRANLVYACMPCNQAKHAKNGVEFYRYRERLALVISEHFERWWKAQP